MAGRVFFMLRCVGANHRVLFSLTLLRSVFSNWLHAQKGAVEVCAGSGFFRSLVKSVLTFICLAGVMAAPDIFTYGLLRIGCSVTRCMSDLRSSPRGMHGKKVTR